MLLNELAGFVSWSAQSGLDDVLTRDAYWQALRPDKKAEFFVDDYRVINHNKVMRLSLPSHGSYSDEVIPDRQRARLVHADILS